MGTRFTQYTRCRSGYKVHTVYRVLDWVQDCHCIQGVGVGTRLSPYTGCRSGYKIVTVYRV